MAHLGENGGSLEMREDDGVEMEENHVDLEGGGQESVQGILCSAGGIAAALMSVAIPQKWSLGEGELIFPGLFSVPDNSERLLWEASSPPPTEGDHKQGYEEDAQEEDFEVQLDSKYFHSVPLYQEYWLQSLKDKLHRVHQSSLPEMVTHQHLPGLRSVSSTRVVSSPLQRRTLEEAPCTLWQELPEVQEHVLLHTLTPRETQLQEAMFELIGSEASYLKSLRVAVNLFQGSKKLRQTLPSLEHHVLFSNLKGVCRGSEGFLLDLENRLGENVVISEVGDLVLRHRNAFRGIYVPYVTNMMYQETLLSQLMQENRMFVYTLKKLERDPKCQRQTLKSFLVLPFQRITRLRLILENILKWTDPDSLSILSLKEAIEAIHEIVAECDNRVQQMKQTEELVHLEKLVDFGNVKSIPLITSGRYLVHQGPLRHVTVKGHHTMGSVVSFTDVYMHLFNDLLLLSLLKERRFSVQDHALFPAHIRVEALKTDVLGLPPESFLLHLSQNHTGTATAFTLITETRSEKEAWVRALSQKRYVNHKVN